MQWFARLRPAGSGAAAFARFATIELSWLAQPKLAKRAKAGGASDLQQGAGILGPLKKKGYFERSPHLWEWHPHDTATNTFMRRRRWYGWQTPEITPDELHTHVESRLRCWLGRPEISDAFLLGRLLPPRHK
jgi:hypothetical protein